MPSSPSGVADIHSVVLHLLVSNFQPGTLKTFEDYIGACQQATNTVSLLDFQALSDEDQNLVVDVLEAAVINLNVSMSVECWDALFELFRTVERLLGEYSHYMLYLRIAAIEVVMLEQPLEVMSDSMLEAEYSFRNLDISRTPSPLSSLASLSSLRNFTSSPSEMTLDSHNEPPLTAEPLEEVEALNTLYKCPSPADTDSLLTSDTTMPSSNSHCLTLFPTQNILAEDVTPLDNSQSAASDDGLEKKGKKSRSRKPSRVTMSRRKRAASMREDKENIDTDITL